MSYSEQSSTLLTSYL
jgi:hypothetical protein